MTHVGLTPRSLSTAKSAAVDRVIGVYSITCSATGKSYIGSSCDVRGRLGWHKAALRKMTHSRREMQADFVEHGEASFSFEIIARCADEAEAVRDEARRIGDSFKAGCSYNGIIPNATEAKPRAKRTVARAPANKTAVAVPLTEKKRKFLGLREMRRRESYIAPQEVANVLAYINFRTERSFLHLIDAFVKAAGITEGDMSLDVMGDPKFLSAFRQGPGDDLTLNNAQRFRDYVWHFLEEGEQARMRADEAAEKAQFEARRSAHYAKEAAA